MIQVTSENLCQLTPSSRVARHLVSARTGFLPPHPQYGAVVGKNGKQRKQTIFLECYFVGRITEPIRLTEDRYNNIVVGMIPPLISAPNAPWDVLPPGVHVASLTEVKTTFATNPHRRQLFEGLLKALKLLKHAGCEVVYLDGSYVSGKPHPGDFDACWDPKGVNPAKLDKVFLDFSNGRASQKAAFMGEFFISSTICSDIGNTFLEFFQIERFTGIRKGIISIFISTDPLLL